MEETGFVVIIDSLYTVQLLFKFCSDQHIILLLFSVTMEGKNISVIFLKNLYNHACGCILQIIFRLQDFLF